MRIAVLVVLLGLSTVAQAAEVEIPLSVRDLVAAVAPKGSTTVLKAVRVLDEQRKFAGTTVVVVEVDVVADRVSETTLIVADVATRAVYLYHENALVIDATRLAYTTEWKDLNGDKTPEIIFTRTVAEHAEGFTEFRPAEDVYQVRYGRLAEVPRHLLGCVGKKEGALSVMSNRENASEEEAVREEAYAAAAVKALRAAFKQKPAAQRCALANVALTMGNPLNTDNAPPADGKIAVDPKSKQMAFLTTHGVVQVQLVEGGVSRYDYRQPDPSDFDLPAGFQVTTAAPMDGAFVGDLFVFFAQFEGVTKDAQGVASAPARYAGLAMPQGKGVFMYVITEPLPGAATARFADIDRDGRADLVVKDGKKTLAVLRWKGEGEGAWVRSAK